MDNSSLSYSYSQDSVSAAVIDQLRRTRGWVLFFSVMLWIGAVFLLLGGLAMIGIGLIGAAGSLGDVGGFGAQESGMLVGMSLFYILMAAFYIYPALKLGKYAARIRGLAEVPSEQNLVAALNEQRAFWKYVGIMVIVLFALYILVFVVAMVVGVAGAAAAGAMSTP